MLLSTDWGKEKMLHKEGEGTPEEGKVGRFVEEATLEKRVLGKESIEKLRISKWILIHIP